MDFAISRNVLLRRCRELFWIDACTFDGGVEVVHAGNAAGMKADVSRKLLAASDSIRSDVSQNEDGEPARTTTVAPAQFSTIHPNVDDDGDIFSLMDAILTSGGTSKNKEPTPTTIVKPGFSTTLSNVDDTFRNYADIVKSISKGDITGSTFESSRSEQSMAGAKHFRTLAPARSIRPELSKQPSVGSVSNVNSGSTTTVPGTLIQNNTPSEQIRPGLEILDPFKCLEEHIAPAAFHNSAQRVDPPRCHPGTHVEILKRIYDWIIQSEDHEEWLLWLNGAAGAGKSAIMQSVAEQCVREAIAIASFFFRSDPIHHTLSALFATLAYQLIQAIPETSDDILMTIERDPLIFDQSLEDQLQQFLIQPLLRVKARPQYPFVVFIDGLDEVNDRIHQTTLIKLLREILHGHEIPIIFIIASRREPQIEAAFKHEKVFNLTIPPHPMSTEKYTFYGSYTNINVTFGL